MKESVAAEQISPDTRADLGKWLAEQIVLLNIPSGYGPALVTAYMHCFLPRMLVVATLAALRPLLQHGELMDPGFHKARTEYFKNFKFTSGLEAQLHLYDTMIEANKKRKLAKLNAQLNLNTTGFEHSFNVLANLQGLCQYLHLTEKQKPVATLGEITCALLCGLPGMLIAKTRDDQWQALGTDKSFHLGDEHCSRQTDLILVTRHEWGHTSMRVTEGTPVSVGMLQFAQPSRVRVEHSNFRYQDSEIVCQEVWTFDGAAVSLHNQAPAPAGIESVRAICSAMLLGAPIEGAQAVQALNAELRELCNDPPLQQKVGLSRLTEERLAIYLIGKLGPGFRLEDVERLPEELADEDVVALTGVADAPTRLAQYRATTPPEVTISGITCPVSYKRDKQGMLDITVHLARNHQLLFNSPDLDLPFIGRGDIHIELELPGDQPDTFQKQTFNATGGLDQVRAAVTGYLHFVPGRLDEDLTLAELIKKVEVKQPPISGIEREPRTIWLAVGSPMTYNTVDEAFTAAADRVKQWLIDDIITHWYSRTMLGEELHERLAQRLAASLLARLDNREVQLHQASGIFNQHYSHPLSDPFWVDELNDAGSKLSELTAAVDGIQSPRQDNMRVRNLRNAAMRAMGTREVAKAVNCLEHAHDALMELRASRPPRPEPRKRR